MKNIYKTNETFVSADGKIVRLQDVFKGVTNYVGKRERNGLISETNADDYAQDAALDILENLHRYDTTKATNPGAYGYVVARNAHCDILNQKSRSYEDSLSDYEMSDDKGNVHYSSQVKMSSSDAFNADYALLSNEACESIRDYISTFDADDRLVIEMSMNRAKVEDIAERLGCTANAVSVRLCKLRKKLKQDLYYRSAC